MWLVVVALTLIYRNKTCAGEMLTQEPRVSR
jgi:hypothetical protein